MEYELTDSRGNPLSLRTNSQSVDMLDGSTLAEKDPVCFLASIPHDLDSYPLVLLLRVMDGNAAEQLPARAEYPSKTEVAIYTVPGNWSSPFIKKIRSREYRITFGENNAESLYLRLI